MNTTEDTIAAIATPKGVGALSLVRLSGPDTVAVLAGCVPGSKSFPCRQPSLCAFCDQDGEALDQVLVTYFPAPASYSGQDMAEVSCHGSPYLTRTILEQLLRQGARLAEPGEFTLRAFLNGKLDLTQAEAVDALITSQTAYQAKVANRQLQGQLSKTLQPTKEALFDVIAHLETAVEFVEEDVTPASQKGLLDELATVIEQLRKLESSYQWGRRLRDGFVVPIVGRPNAGKSSIFNSLIGISRAIVTEEPGTTRDTLRETIDLSGYPLELMDTAGIRVTENRVEVEGVTRAISSLEEADLVIWVLDGSDSFSDEDQQIFERLSGRHVLVVVNKSDLERLLLVPKAVRDQGWKSVSVSALAGAGLEDLEKTVALVLTSSGVLEEDSAAITNARHGECLRRSLRSLEKGVAALRKGMSEEFSLYDFRRALEQLGEITGESSTEDLLGRIFSTFCIGK